MTTPFDVALRAVNRWLHDYSHRRQAKDKGIKRWHKFQARLSEELKKKDIYEMEGWFYRSRDLPPMIGGRSDVLAEDVRTTILREFDEVPEGCEVEWVKSPGSWFLCLRVKGRHGSVVYGRVTDWGKGRK